MQPVLRVSSYFFPLQINLSGKNPIPDMDRQIPLVLPGNIPHAFQAVTMVAGFLLLGFT